MNVRARESFRVCRGVFWSSLLKVGEVALVLLNQILRFLSWRLWGTHCVPFPVD
ncbi:protein of unknown function [Methylotuvimicrobium alcaliphilum 20Z]|uniref:Uncharacterized protein n=1 Tax=Methylotuvimicrobium alcaliphilum (strain DSM 19304 / NCIMB 14124 / VKM B-2133 / 20Z) TaxID=1091494 RepID=G4SZZ9_META2|nr:protein of unknown function [Methylotuvimicrobium alcaliphilum 20Z]